MAKRPPKKKRFSVKGFDLEHYKATGQYMAAVNALFDRAASEVANMVVKGKYSTDKPFLFKDYPDTHAAVQKIATGLANNMQAIIEKGSQRQWLFANKKNDEFLASIMDTSKLTKKRLEKMQDKNLDALKAFQQRKVDGMNLSQRVWKYVGQFKEQIEHGIDVGLGDGVSAQKLSKDLRQNLRDPDRLFRRVRDKHGNLQLSKVAKAFHPGQGVYRSSYKNAMRLTRSEINMAYRESDWLRWQSLDFVVGIEIHRTQKENKYECKLCDRLIGRYPKHFKFKGWHPQCMCYATAILMDEDDFDNQELSDLRSALYGTEYKKLSVKNKVVDYPDGFKDWVAENSMKQANWKSTPYFIRDNFKNGLLADGLKYVPEDAPIKRIKTEAEKIDIQKRWNTRRAMNEFGDGIDYAMGEYADVPSLKKWLEKTQNAINNGEPFDEISKMMSKFDNKVKVLEAWDERVEINRLETVLVDVKGLKEQHAMASIYSAFNAVKAKLDEWKHLSWKEQAKKLEFEINWVGKNQKYDTWKAAQDAYKKRLVAVNYEVVKEEVKATTTNAFAFAKTTKSVKVKQLADEIKVLLSNNNASETTTLKQKALLLNSEVAKLEAAKLARQMKKPLPTIKGLDESNYTKERKDAALWAKSAADADKNVREVVELVWQKAKAHERLSAFRYTAGSSYINEPLRGQYYSGQYKGKYDSKKDADALTSIVNKSAYQFDMWLQRGVGYEGVRGLFGVDLYGKSPQQARAELIGKIGLEPAFSSCANTKGSGFSNKPVIYYIYCPRGTKMLYAEPFSAFGNGAGKTWDGKTKQTSFGSEAEMIMQRGTQFRVTRVEQFNGQWRIDLEVVGQI